MSKKPLTDKNGEVREITKKEMKQFTPIQEADPEFLAEMKSIQAKRQRGRPKMKAPKQMLSLRLKSNIVAGIKSSGKGYNAKIEKLLEEALEEGRL